MAEELASVGSKVTPQPANRAHILKLWKIAGVLLFVTAIEFAFAFGLPESFEWTKISIFIGLTLVKAFYIVSEFMHLKYETKVLIWSILIPAVFLVWLLIALGYEGGGISMVY